MNPVHLLRACALWVLLLAAALALSKSADASVLGRYSPERAATIAVALFIGFRLLAAAAAPPRADRGLQRLRLLVSLPAVAAYALLLLLAAFFLPDFLFSLRYHANLIMLLTASGVAAVLILPDRWARRNVMSRIALMLVSIVVCLVALEIALRLLPKRGFHELRAGTGINTLTNIAQSASWGTALRLSPNRKRIYEFMPGSRFTFMDKRVSINADGFRDQDRPRAKPPGTFRVAGLGDSVMFGWGVEEPESFLRQAEGMLADCPAGVRFELMNFGVPGYNTVMEVETFRERALPYDPDLVVVSFVWNDLDLPNFIQRPEPARNTLAVSWVGNLLFRRNHQSMDALINAPRGGDESRFESDPARVPDAYRELVGWDAYRGAMSELASLAHGEGFDVLIMSHDVVPADVKALIQQLGFDFVELGSRWREYCAERGIADPESAWPLSADDPHPSVAGNRVLAGVLADAICAWARERGGRP